MMTKHSSQLKHIVLNCACTGPPCQLLEGFLFCFYVYAIDHKHPICVRQGFPNRSPGVHQGCSEGSPMFHQGLPRVDSPPATKGSATVYQQSTKCVPQVQDTSSSLSTFARCFQLWMRPGVRLLSCCAPQQPSTRQRQASAGRAATKTLRKPSGPFRCELTLTRVATRRVTIS